MRINYNGKSKILGMLCTETNRLTEACGTISKKVGDLKQLTTADKSSLVKAVNEVRGMVDGVLGGSS